MKTITNLITTGIFLAAANSTFAAIHYVDLNSPSPTPPYTSWGTAATNIQQAVDAATAGDQIMVTNGIYATGGRAVYGTMTNRVAVDKPLALQSVNGPQFTIIQGYQVLGITNGDGAIRCVYLTNGASLSGFTLTNGGADNGAGVWCESTNASISNCVIAVNSAYNFGGGAFQGTFNTCLFSGNVAGDNGGGVEGPASLVNCGFTNNSSLNGGGGADSSTLDACILSGNSAPIGGGASGSTLNNCTLTGNSGGGVENSTLDNCVLSGNSATYYNGGGAGDSVLNNCVLTGNTAYQGGGAYEGTLNNCTLDGNTAYQGGGACQASLNNCSLTGNSASSDGGGVCGGILNNCTLTGNSAQSGGGASGIWVNIDPNTLFPVTLNNCIIYFNSAPTGANYTSSTVNYSCTTPLPPGTGNISVDPQLTDSSHLNAGSPCRRAGSTDFVSGTDIDGEPWANPPSIGCDEYYSGTSGPLQLVVTPDYTNAASGFTVNLNGSILGHATSNRWDFGDGTSVTGQLYQPMVSHFWMNAGAYVVTLSAYNDSYPAGVSASVTINVVAQPVYYVSLSSTNPVPPYSSWATAATNIQDAVDAATVAGALVFVTNGTYATGGRSQDGVITNRVLVNKPLILSSVNGPQFTVIDGGTAFRCAYLSNTASLTGFTLTNGGADNGAGVWCGSLTAVVSNCVVIGNFAGADGGGAFGGTLNNCTLSGNSAFDGGAAYQGTLNNCTLNGNFAGDEGGGAYGGTLNNCTLAANSADDGGYFDASGGGASAATLNNCALTDNSADFGGGANSGTLNNCTLTGNSVPGNNGGGGGVVNATLNNCIVYFNTATDGANYDSSSTLNYCCTTPLPPGSGNISADPQLTDSAHLSASSPCIGAGSAAFTSGVDIDGDPWANPPSIGCDEYYANGAIGPLTVNVATTRTNTAIEFPVQLTAEIQGRATLSMWNFGDGTLATNQPYASHVWASTGTYTVVLTAYNQSYPVGVSASVTIYVDDRLRVTTAPATDWTSVACSADGTKLVAVNAGNLINVVSNDFTGQVYTSANTGGTWTLSSAPPALWDYVTSSADGTNLAVVGDGGIYTSADSGGTWTLTSAPHADLPDQPDYRGIASSADGAKLVAVSAGTRSNGDYNFFLEPIYTSTNFGATWTTTTAPNEGWLGVASSADGTKLVAVAGVDSTSVGGTAGGPIYTSTNSGASWTAANAPIARWFCVASSADGMKLAAGAFGDQPGGGIYISGDGGKNWTLTSAPTDEGWLAIASSADGTRLVAASEGVDYIGGPIYASADSGVTWSLTEAPIQVWDSIASSADGSKIVASVWYGPIYTLQFPLGPSLLAPPPRLSISSSGGSLKVSWFVPSTSFSLQQNSDLTTTNWTDVPLVPTIDFTNLNYQVTASPTNGQSFYRLKQQ